MHAEASAMPKRRKYRELEVDIRERQVWFKNEMLLGHNPHVRDIIILEHLDFMEHKISG